MSRMLVGNGLTDRTAHPVARWLIGGLAVLLGCLPVWGQETAVTVLADFESSTVAARIGDTHAVAPGDCRVRNVAIPARGQGALSVEIGATQPRVAVVVDLVFREPMRFSQANRIAAYCWIGDAPIGVAFRLRDSAGQLFETPAQNVTLPNRWVEVASDLTPTALERLQGSTALTFPVQLEALRIVTTRQGRQTVVIDDLQMEHRVAAPDLVAGTFSFDEPTRFYEPGSTVRAAVVLENRSRQVALNTTVKLAWTRADGSVLQTQQANISLPVSGIDYRSTRKLDFSQRVTDAGLYRLVAEVHAPGWPTTNVFETTIAVTPSNRRVARGRSTFFGVRTNLLREPLQDQLLEISVARDMGVNLLALDVPWETLEPKRGNFDFDTLATPLQTIIQRDMAVLLVLTEPPDWVPTDPQERLLAISDALSATLTRFGAGLRNVLVTRETLGEDDPAAHAASLDAIRARLLQRHPDTVVYGPLLVIDSAAQLDIGTLRSGAPDLPRVFQTRGDTATALRDLEAFQARTAYRWQSQDLWLHHAAAVSGTGQTADAEAVLRHYVAAAAAGVGGLLWSDLRDDDNDPARPAQQRGLIRRDFGPRTTMIGYASTAGLLTGLRGTGPVPGTPEGFDSALFVGSTQQIGVLLPPANRILPAVLAPFSSAAGTFTVTDFERRAVPVLTSSYPTLFVTAPRPLFVVLTLERAQSEPHLTLRKPWLRAPSIVFAGENTGFNVELDALQELRRSFLQVRLGREAPIEASFQSASLSANAGDTLTQRITLAPRAEQRFEHVELTLRASIEGQTVEVPLTVRPLSQVRALTAETSLSDPRYRLDALAPVAAGLRPTAEVTLHAAFKGDRLLLAWRIKDDRLIPFAVDENGRTRGDFILVGLAREGHPQHTEARLTVAGTPSILAVHGTPSALLADWRITAEDAPDGFRVVQLNLPISHEFGKPWMADDRLLIATTYSDDDADGFPAVRLHWGRGLDGTGVTTGFRWAVVKNER
ncbi:MAG: hypothetical protein IPM18_10420 [Phycisphaerales bacterium]|nr:hypothetical protein [Phycisphaerales bacterium]